MNPEKKPQIPEWKRWILIITMMMALTAIQNYQIHNQMWEAIHDTSSVMEQKIQSDIEYHQMTNQILMNQLQILERFKEFYACPNCGRALCKAKDLKNFSDKR